MAISHLIVLSVLVALVAPAPKMYLVETKVSFKLNLKYVMQCYQFELFWFIIDIIVYECQKFEIQRGFHHLA